MAATERQHARVDGAQEPVQWESCSPREQLDVSLTFLLFGMSMLAPFNTLVTASEYFRDAFSTSPALASGFNSGLMFVYNAASVLFSVLATLSGGRKGLDIPRRIQGALQLLIGTSVFVIGTVLLRPSEGVRFPYAYFALLLVIACVYAAGVSYFQNAAMGMAAKLGVRGKFVALVFSGQGIQGVLVSAVNLVSVWLASGSGEQDPPNVAADKNRQVTLLLFVSTLALLAVTYVLLLRTQKGRFITAHGRPDAAEVASSGAESQTFDRQAWDTIVRVQKAILPWSFTILYVFAITLAVYPSLTSLVRTVHGASSPLQNASLFVGIGFLAFNGADLLGRHLPGLSSALVLRRGALLVASALARTLLIPALLACNLVWPGSPSASRAGWRLPDSAFFALLVVLGVTNGWLATSTMMTGPEVASTAHMLRSERLPTHEPTDGAEDEQQQLGADEGAGQSHDSAVAAMLLSFELVLGLTVGSLGGFALLAIA